MDLILQLSATEIATTQHFAVLRVVVEKVSSGDSHCLVGLTPAGQPFYLGWLKNARTAANVMEDIAKALQEGDGYIDLADCMREPTPAELMRLSTPLDAGQIHPGDAVACETLADVDPDKPPE